MHGTFLDDRPAQPFLRWAGGKSSWAQVIVAKLPELGRTARYFEPFLGAASVFLAYAPRTSYLSDRNVHLIATFSEVRDDPAGVARHLRVHKARDSEAHFYRVRDRYNAHRSRTHDVQQAARFIYLNKACFNGIFRVNRRGEFNVPYGYRKYLAIPDEPLLRAVSVRLRTCTLRALDFNEALGTARRGDVVYLDPPYPPLSATAYFAHYTAERFDQADQEQVALVAHNLADRGAKVLVTNADTRAVRKLYRGWSVSAVDRVRWVTSSVTKHKVRELLISSY